MTPPCGSEWKKPICCAGSTRHRKTGSSSRSRPAATWSAYLGDGVNDAPSLQSADVGLSADSAVDVAKEAADMILLDRDLHVLNDGVLEGRRTFVNIMNYIMTGTSPNCGNMFSMAGAALFLPFLPMLPTQILLNNILYDVSEVPIPLSVRCCRSRLWGRISGSFRRPPSSISSWRPWW